MNGEVGCRANALHSLILHELGMIPKSWSGASAVIPAAFDEKRAYGVTNDESYLKLCCEVVRIEFGRSSSVIDMVPFVLARIL